MFILFNPNPRGNFVGDCVIRAICKLTNRSWEDVYMSIAIQGFMMKDMLDTTQDQRIRDALTQAINMLK